MSELFSIIYLCSFTLAMTACFLKWHLRRKKAQREHYERMRQIAQSVDEEWDRMLRDMLEQTVKATLQARATQTWAKVLGLSLPVDESQVKAAFRSLSKTQHPDSGGTKESMQALVQARDQALQWIAKNGPVKTA